MYIYIYFIYIYIMYIYIMYIYIYHILFIQFIAASFLSALSAFRNLAVLLQPHSCPGGEVVLYRCRETAVPLFVIRPRDKAWKED